MILPTTDAETVFSWTIRLPYRWGQVVYLKATQDKDPGLVVTFNISPGGIVQVGVRWGNANLNYVYPFELTTEYLPDFAQLEP
jgi:hypothetical protein